MIMRYLDPWGAMLLLGSWLAFHVVHVCSFLALRAFQIFKQYMCCLPCIKVLEIPSLRP